MELINKQDAIDLIDGYIANMEECNISSFGKNSLIVMKDEVNLIDVQNKKPQQIIKNYDSSERIDYNAGVVNNTETFANAPFYKAGDTRDTQTFSDVPIEKKKNPFDDMLLIKRKDGTIKLIESKKIIDIEIFNDYGLFNYDVSREVVYFSLNPHIEKLVKERIENESR